ncbi:diacylglycerol kinase family protein [Herbiconiux sp. KACC 21604]|uniref:diacylglycerol/lipid kinase family protein n=1 Tax=unclassified Herbiconiux TaxID=2618217 RepID=UPI001492EA41|nr:diacylglycerol kinase family protein [Herbiconiux sp. SALV-R1]QJU53186.1 diacylglycerol kinase [Herbiconiux sp. SALV-R1]WPO88134.1 diacylglycerol kinase family protein [Herbiconiux sp. KACC 21604]
MTTPPRAALVYNPVKVDLEALREAVSAEEATAGWGETLWLETTEDDPGPGQAKKALAEKVDLVIAAGGDGTVRSVAEVLRGSGVPLALLPSGTGNLLARNLDLTLDDTANSLETAFRGDDRSIDLGVIRIRHEDDSVSEHAYLVMAGLGLDAKMLAATDDELKARVGWLAYVKAIAQVLRDKNQLRIRYNLDGKGNRSVRAHTIMIGNCGSLPANILLLPDAAVDDGQFDIVVLRPEGFIGWVQIMVKVFWENGVLRRNTVGRKLMGLTKEVRALNYLKGSSLTLRLQRPEEIELDGDGFGKAVALKTWVDAGSLTVKVPADA